MKQNRKIAYCSLLLAGILTVGAAAAAVGTARARYTTTAGWDLQLQQPRVELTSDLMACGGQTVLLGELDVEDTMTVYLNLDVSGGSASGRLNFGENPYVTAASEEVIDGTAQEFTITLTPTEDAKELTAATTATLRVSWDDELWADLQVRLTPAEGIPETTAAEDASDGEETDTEPETTAAAVPTASGFLSGMTGFDPEELLAVQLTVPEQCTHFSLLLDGGAFPAGTRYSTDGGQTYTLLYSASEIELEALGDSMTILMDLSSVAQEKLTLTAEAYCDEVQMGRESLTVTADEDLPELEAPDAPIVLTKETQLILGVPQNCGGALMTFHIQAAGETGTESQVFTSMLNGNLIISAYDGTTYAPPGTYELEIQWTYAGAVVAQRQFPFYINYSPYTRASEDISIDAAEPQTPTVPATEEPTGTGITEETTETEETEATTEATQGVTPSVVVEVETTPATEEQAPATTTGGSES